MAQSRMPSQRKRKIVVIGGGTGSFAVLSGLKTLDCDLTALVNMVDDGGSTGQLRDDYGVLPPGDVRQCLVALSDAPQSLRNLFGFRFPVGGNLAGHSFGNLFLSAVEMMTDNFHEAVKMASDVLNIKGRVLPVTTEKCNLVMDGEKGKVTGQRSIEDTKLKVGTRPHLYLEPDAKMAADVLGALEKADLIVIAPGNLYTSIIPTLLVGGVSECLQAAKAKVIYVCNLVNKPNNTFNFKVSDYVSEIERFAGEGTIDYVLYNIDAPSEELLNKYAQDKEYLTIVDEDNLNAASYQAISAKLLSHRVTEQDENDILLKRSYLRHDSRRLANEIKKIIEAL